MTTATRPVKRGQPLTAREIEIGKLAAAGYTNQEIGDRIGRSHFTIKSHLGRIFTKTGVRTRAGLASYLSADLRFLTTVEVCELLDRTRADLNSRVAAFGSIDYYRHQGAEQILKAITDQLHAAVVPPVVVVSA